MALLVMCSIMKRKLSHRSRGLEQPVKVDKTFSRLKLQTFFASLF